jgi:sugar phosphate isomerase/epimerase
MTRARIGLQLFSVRGECQRSLPATLKETARIGYEGVELWGYMGDSLAWMSRSAAAIRSMCDDVGIACCGIHLSTAAMLGDHLTRTLEFSRILGARFLIVAIDHQRMSTRTGVRELAGILNDAAAKLAPHGMFTGYHAHPSDFVRVDGEVAWEALFRETAPSLIMQLDIGNTMRGGGDPVALLKRFPQRARTLHISDFGGAEDSAAGEGKADWAGIFGSCGTARTTEWYVVEQGGTEGIGFDIPRRSFAWLRDRLAKRERR